MVLEENEENEPAEEGAVDKPRKKTEKKLPPPSQETGLSALGLEELKQALMKSIDEEDYEQASKIRDELNKRKQSSDQ